MPRAYRFGPTRRAVNVAMTALLRLGIPAPQRTSYLMTTRGRRTGTSRTMPVNLVVEGGRRWLVSPYGDVGWVHKLRAEPILTLGRGRHRESLIAHEIAPADAGPVLKRYRHSLSVPYGRHRDALGTAPKRRVEGARSTQQRSGLRAVVPCLPRMSRAS
jgi:deazaflavin-dependent oxidoreductase (nitroreductase family)